MGTVDIQATFAKGSKKNNGLEAIADDLVKDPLTPRWAVVRLFVPTTKVDNLGGGSSIPVVRMDIIEPMLSNVDEADARKLLERAYRARVGHAAPEVLTEPEPEPPSADEQDTPLPLDMPDRTEGAAQ